MGLTLEAEAYYESVRAGGRGKDCHEHLDRFRALAKGCVSVVEFGSWTGTSAPGFLAGLLDAADDGLRQLTCVDINEKCLNDAKEGLQPLLDLYPNKVKVNYIKADTTQQTFSLDCDLLFIDTWHVAKQIRKELELHGNWPRKYLCFHDTVTFGMVGEDGECPGIREPIDDFLELNPHWKIDEEWEHNNGLLVLRRH